MNPIKPINPETSLEPTVDYMLLYTYIPPWTPWFLDMATTPAQYTSSCLRPSPEL